MSITKIYNLFIYVIIFVTFTVDFVYPVFPEYRYLRYIGIPLFLILFSKRQKLKGVVFNERVRAYLFLIVTSLLLFPLLKTQGILELIFIFAGVCMFIFTFEVKLNVKAINNFALFLFLTLFAWRGDFNFGQEALFDSSTSSVEGGYSFIFGFFCVYFWEKKKYLRFIINFIFLILALKRIVLIGVVFVILISILPKRLSNLLTSKVFLISANIFFIFLIQLFTNGVFDDLIREVTGLSPGHFTGGRTLLYSLVFNDSTFNGIDYAIGIGSGNATLILEDYFGHIFLLHNDILKIVVEHGYIIFTIFLFILYNSKDKRIVRLTIFLNVLYLTDNPLIYQIVFMMYFFICHLYKSESSPLTENSHGPLSDRDEVLDHTGKASFQGINQRD